MIASHELREKYQKFFESKGHARIASAPLVPENDPSVLFTTAGMHALVPYLKGQPHPQGKRLVDVQKCLRTTDIEAVGDATHATVFEMLGNWSLGSYFKKEAIEWSWEFLTDKKWLGIDPDYLAVSVFAGGKDAPCDDESAKLWQAIGIPKERLAYLDERENWWPAGGAAPGPQGPDTEMFYWSGSNNPPKKFDPSDEKWVEIWNDVFMEYNRTEEGRLERLAQQNVDTGMGLERTVMVLNGLQSIYEIDSYRELMSIIKKGARKKDERHERIIADHLKAAVFILGDENPVTPSNAERGYVLRRLIRRAVRSARQLGTEDVASLFDAGLDIVAAEFGQTYPSLNKYKDRTRGELESEIDKSEVAIRQGEPIARKLIESKKRSSSGYRGRGYVTGAESSTLWQSYGYPLEMLEDMAKEEGIEIRKEEHLQKEREHQEKSRLAAVGKFAGGLADQSYESVKYHTATHLLHRALRETLGDHVLQRGSNITSERLRFDFSHPEKMTSEEIKQVAKLVNEKIKADLPVKREEMTVEEAKKKGALGLFEHKYGERVSVYTIGNYSTEICGGPHVKRTGELGVFKITKEESSSSGIRRIKAQFDRLIVNN